MVSDLQRTSRAEFWRESNPAERESILRRIAEGRPDFVAMLGDLVFRGSSKADWRHFDEICRPLIRRRTPVYPILGNHEYWTSRPAGLANYFVRFPHLQGRRWYAARYGPLVLLCLDSNETRLAAAEWSRQRAWYCGELARLEEDPSVRGVLVLVHHPPYTNSTVTRDEIHVQREFVAPFVAARKTLAMLSGHVHSYERFARSGKLFVVTGGGGGPRVRLARSGSRLRHADDLFGGPAVRLFHFLEVQLRDEGLDVEAVGLPKGGRIFETMDRFRLPYGGTLAETSAL